MPQAGTYSPRVSPQSVRRVSELLPSGGSTALDVDAPDWSSQLTMARLRGRIGERCP